MPSPEVLTGGSERSSLRRPPVALALASLVVLVAGLSAAAHLRSARSEDQQAVRTAELTATSNGPDLIVSTLGAVPMRVTTIHLEMPEGLYLFVNGGLRPRRGAVFPVQAITCPMWLVDHLVTTVDLTVQAGAARAIRAVSLDSTASEELTSALRRRCGYLPAEQALSASFGTLVRHGRDLTVPMTLVNGSAFSLQILGFLVPVTDVELRSGRSRFTIAPHATLGPLSLVLHANVCVPHRVSTVVVLVVRLVRVGTDDTVAFVEIPPLHGPLVDALLAC